VKAERIGFATIDKRPPAQTKLATSEKAVGQRNDKKDDWRPGQLLKRGVEGGKLNNQEKQRPNG
jgi:hypothetical protein